MAFPFFIENLHLFDFFNLRYKPTNNVLIQIDKNLHRRVFLVSLEQLKFLLQSFLQTLNDSNAPLKVVSSSPEFSNSPHQASINA